MSFGISISDLALILNGLVRVYETIKDAPRNFADLLAEYKLFSASVQHALALLDSGVAVGAEQQRSARLIFKACSKTLRGLKGFLFTARSLDRGSPKLRDMLRVTPEQVAGWKGRIEAQKAYLILFHSAHHSADLADIKKSIQFLVAREASRIQTDSSGSVHTIDSLSTTSREHWSEIRRALEEKGISPRTLNQYKDRILVEIDNVVSGNGDLHTQPDGDGTLIEQTPEDDKKASTALLLAAEQNNWDGVKQFIENNPALDVTTLASRLTFALAVLRHAWDVVTIFVEKEFNPDGKSADLQPVICIAASCQSWNTVRLLAERGANLESRDSTGHTALLRAAFHRNWAMVFSLADAGAKINTVAAASDGIDSNRPTSPTTVLSYAVMHRAWGQFASLLERGADANSRCLRGSPVVTVAASFKSWDVAACLIKHGADIHAEDQVGKTVVDYVAASMSPELLPHSSPEERLQLAAVAVHLLKKGVPGRGWFHEGNPLIQVLFPDWDTLRSLV
ncbi:ankyrin repeat-containing domain protein [Aspergillus pseudoustus]|uniref:Ankyrin repeat-containing domain protein n=1 Tax=Aspergillus pseudoustus TaxID=1810923 RepID=A0ABR4JIF1_9EURO